MTKKSQPAAGGTNICSFEALHFGDDGRSVQGGKWEYWRVKKKRFGLLTQMTIKV